MDARDTGRMPTEAITGSRAPGFSRHALGSCGRPATGASARRDLRFHAGYWGPHIGFYGGVNYGFGYGGAGYRRRTLGRESFCVQHRSRQRQHHGGSQHLYEQCRRTITYTVNKVSYNGGAGGVAAAPTSQERMAAQEPHVPPTPMQHQHVQEAVRNPALSAAANGGHPAIAATPRPAAFNAPGVVGARGAAPLHAPGAANPAYAAHGNATVGGTPPRATANAYQPHPPTGNSAATGNPAHPQTTTTAPQAGHAPPPPQAHAQPPKPAKPPVEHKHENEGNRS